MGNTLFNPGDTLTAESLNAALLAITASIGTVTFVGDVAGSGMTSSTIDLNLVDTGVAAGIYNNVSVDATGRVTFGENVEYAIEGENGNSINGGTVYSDLQGTVVVSGTVTTIVAQGSTRSVVLQGQTAGGTTVVNIGPGYPGQEFRLEFQQGATPTVWNLGTACLFGTTITSFTATPSANVRDLLELVNYGTVDWLVVHVAKGFAI